MKYSDLGGKIAPKKRFTVLNKMRKIFLVDNMKSSLIFALVGINARCFITEIKQNVFVLLAAFLKKRQGEAVHLLILLSCLTPH